MFPAPFLLSVCIHNNTQKQKIGKTVLFPPDIIHMMNETRPSPFLLMCFIVNANGRGKNGVGGWLGMSLLGSPFLGLLLISLFYNGVT